jgi:hypothetical protein
MGGRHGRKEDGIGVQLPKMRPVAVWKWLTRGNLDKCGDILRKRVGVQVE